MAEQLEDNDGRMKKEDRKRLMDTEQRMVVMELEQAESLLKSVDLDAALKERWEKRVVALRRMVAEYAQLINRINAEDSSEGGNDMNAVMPSVSREILTTMEELGMEVAAADHGTDLVLLYKEYGQDIEKFRSAIHTMKQVDLERMNGVGTLTLTEELRAPFPDMPVFWRKGQALLLLKYLAILRSTGSHTVAQRASGVLNRVVRYVEGASEMFQKIKEDALDENANVLEDEARRRAVEGVDEPVFYQGDVVGYTKKYSDDLLKMLLRANRREKYSIERKQDALINIQNNTFNLDNVNIDGLRDRLKTKIEGRLVDAEVQRVTQTIDITPAALTENQDERVGVKKNG